MLSFCSLLLFVLFCLFSESTHDIQRMSPFHLSDNFFRKIILIFKNNLLSTLFYLIPGIGTGKFMFDVYLTAISIKSFIYENSIKEFITLFIPHFIFEFYAININIYISYSIIKDLITNKSHTINIHFYLLLTSTSLLLIAAIIEAFEGSFLK